MAPTRGMCSADAIRASEEGGSVTRRGLGEGEGEVEGVVVTVDGLEERYSNVGKWACAREVDGVRVGRMRRVILGRDLGSDAGSFGTDSPAGGDGCSCGARVVDGAFAAASVDRCRVMLFRPMRRCCVSAGGAGGGEEVSGEEADGGWRFRLVPLDGGRCVSR